MRAGKSVAFHIEKFTRIGGPDEQRQKAPLDRPGVVKGPPAKNAAVVWGSHTTQPAANIPSYCIPMHYLPDKSRCVIIQKHWDVMRDMIFLPTGIAR